jgi:competence protein ComGC
MDQFMNTPVQPPPRTSPLAITSLVLGVFSVTCLFLFAGIPAVICGHMAQSRIKYSGGRLGGNGFALAGLITGYLSIGFSLFILPLLLAIAIPNFVKARHVAQSNVCRNQMRWIDGSKQLWAVEHERQLTDVPSEADLAPYLEHRTMPICPAGGTYSINAVEESPTCSVPDHSLD